MTIRSYSRPDTSTSTSVKVVDNEGVTQVDSSCSYPSSRRYGVYTGRPTRHYHKAVKAGEMLPLNAYSRFDYRAKCSQSLATWANTSDGWSGHNGCWASETLLWSLSIPPNGAIGTLPLVRGWGDLNSDALIIAAMADILPDLDALTTAVEARKTVQMVLNARRDAKELIRTALRGGKHTVKAASDAWMAWRYGWQTLGYDIQNCYEFLKEPAMNIVVSGQSGTSFSEESTESENLTWDYADVIHNKSITCDQSFRARVIAKWHTQTLNAIADPAITAWESVPYSFVADWFVNVGDVLAAWKVRNSVSRMHASLGTKTTLRVVTDLLLTERSPRVGGGTASATEVYTSKDRMPASIPSLVPSFDVQLTYPRLLDAAAILSKRIL